MCSRSISPSTYWDRLGWKDTFARPQYTERQYAYSSALRAIGVYTPQIVVNGRAEGVGDESEMEALAAQTTAAPRGASGRNRGFSGGGRQSGRARRLRAAPTSGSRAISPHGRSRGRARRERRPTLPYKDVVREMILLGKWRGEAASFPLPGGAKSGLAEAAIVQGVGCGPVIAAENADLAPG